MKLSSRTSIGAFIATSILAGVLAFATPSGAATEAPSLATPSGATGTISVTDPLLGVKEDTFTAVAFLSAGGCSAAIAANQVTLTFNGAPTTAATFQLDPGFFAKYQFSISIPSGLATVPGQSNVLGVSVTCNVSATPTTFTGTFSWSQIDVTKVVEGNGPAGATYPITVACTTSARVISTGPTAASPPSSFQFTLAAGQTKSLFTTDIGLCTVTEADSLGATSNSPIVVDITAPVLYSAVLTNSYPTAPTFTG